MLHSYYALCGLSLAGQSSLRLILILPLPVPLPLPLTLTPTLTRTPTPEPSPGQTQLLPISCTLGISMRAAAEGGFAPSELAEQCESCQ